MNLLVQTGLMPADDTARKDLVTLDPYWLRAEALSERLELHQVGRAIAHINQRPHRR